MKRRPWRLPTILGLLFLLISLLAGLFLVESGQVFFLRANPEIAPREIKISNITDASLTISWVTTGLVNGFVQIEKEGEKRVFGDDRDQLAGQVGQYSSHHVTVKNLEPLGKYLFRIGSGGKMFDNSGRLFEVTTGPTLIQAPPTTDPAYGEVNTIGGEPAQGAIVYLSLPGAVLQSTLVKPSGSWLITLSLARSDDLTRYAVYDRQNSSEQVFVQGGQLGTASAVFETKADSPAPTLILGQDLLEQAAPAMIVTPTLAQKVTFSGFVAESESMPTVSLPEPDLQIDYPSLGEVVMTTRPEFFGKGPRQTVLEIILNSPGFFGQVVTDDQGNWRWSPPENLSPGEHKIIVRYQDESGQVKRAEHSFTVLAAQDSDLPSFTSTPSATPVPTAVPTISPTPLPSPIPTSTPTVPPRTIQPGIEPGVPKPGHLTPTFWLTIIGIVIFSLGFIVKKHPVF